MKVYLVINKNKDAKFLPYTEQFKLIKDQEKALEYAKDLGYDSMMPFDDTVGMGNMYQGGDVNVMILPLEIKEDKGL